MDEGEEVEEPEQVCTDTRMRNNIAAKKKTKEPLMNFEPDGK